MDIYDNYNVYEKDMSFEINYNSYETPSISFCINRYDIEQYDVIINENDYEEIEGIGKCFKVNSDRSYFKVRLQYNYSYQEPTVSTQTDDVIYN